MVSAMIHAVGNRGRHLDNDDDDDSSSSEEDSDEEKEEEEVAVEQMRCYVHATEKVN